MSLGRSTAAWAPPEAQHVSQPARSGGERRQVTALFYDIVGSTALLNRLDPEDFGALQGQVHAAASAVFERNGSRLDQVQGDGGCAYFGYPVPAEDAAESALEAALELVERCRHVTPSLQHGEQLRIRVGIATSVVVIGGPTRVPTEARVIGIAPNLAARAQSLAEPDCVVVADSTYHLTRHAFDFEPLGSFELKGFSEPQRLWRVIARRAPADRLSSLRRAETPLVSREAELDLCRQRWSLARQGQGQFVFLVGEAGIGKSRLVDELRRELADASCDVRIFQCQPRGNTRPLHPFLNRLRREISGSADRQTAPSPSAVRAYLAQAAPGISAESVESIAFFLHEGADPQAAHPNLASLGPDEIKQRALQAAVDVIASWCRARPQLLILEDLYWADTLTLAFVARCVQEVSGLPALIVATHRNPISSDLTSHPHVLSIELARLDASAVEPLVAAIWRPQPPPPGLAAFVAAKGDGIPLFVEELAYFLKDRHGATAGTPLVWERLLHEGTISTLEDLLAARLAALGESRRVAQIASVIGREVPEPLLAKLVEGEDLAQSLDAHLEVLARAGLIRQRGGKGDAAFRFWHVLLQEAASTSLLKWQRRELHDRIVRLVASKSVADLPDEVMAWHCEQSGRPFEAARFAIRAAEACAIRSATLEAERLLAAAESHLSACAPDANTDDLTLQLLAIRGPVAVQLFGKGSREACAVYERGVAICRQRGPQDREKWFPLYWGWWFTSPNRGTKRMRAQVIMKDLDSAVDPEIRLQALHCAWAANFHAGNHFECLQNIQQGLALYDPSPALMSRIKYGGHDAKVCALAERGLSQWLTGDEEAATKSVEAAVDWAKEIGHLGSLCHALDYAIMLRRYQNDVGEVAALAGRMREIAEQHGVPDVLAKSQIFRGWAKALSGSVADGLHELEEGVERQQAIGTDEDWPVYREMRAEVLCLAQDFRAARQLLDDAIDHAERTGNLVWLPELYRRRAHLHATSGDSPKLAQEDLERGLALAQIQGVVALIDRARADLDRLTSVPSPGG